MEYIKNLKMRKFISWINADKNGKIKEKRFFKVGGGNGEED